LKYELEGVLSLRAMDIVSKALKYELEGVLSFRAMDSVSEALGHVEISLDCVFNMYWTRYREVPGVPRVPEDNILQSWEQELNHPCVEQGSK
jgi:hypothetical protein